jgi:hypothetical protein
MNSYICYKIDSKNNLEKFLNFENFENIPKSRQDLINLLNSIGLQVPNNLSNLILASGSNTTMDMSKLNDEDNNYILNLIQTFITEKNSLLNDIKEAIHKAYNLDNTILNFFNNSTNVKNFSNLLRNTYLDKKNNYKIISKILDPNVITKTTDQQNSTIINFNIASLEISFIDSFIDILKNLEIIIPVFVAFYGYYNKLDSNNKGTISDAIFYNKFELDAPLSTIKSNALQIKSTLDTNLIQPFLKSQCDSNNDCSNFYNNIVLSIPTNTSTLKSWLLSSSIKNKLINILKINYSSISAVVNLWEEIINIDNDTYNNIQNYQNEKNLELKKNLATKIIRDHVIIVINNMINSINNSGTGSSVVSTNNSSKIQSEIIKGVPNLYLYAFIGGFVFLILLIIIAKK